MTEWSFRMTYVANVTDESYIVSLGKIQLFFIFSCLYVLKILTITGYFKCKYQTQYKVAAYEAVNYLIVILI